MNPERWQQIATLFHKVLECKPEDRPAFLDEACGADANLRREIDSLLACETDAEGFIEEPAVAIVAPLVATPEARLVAGQRFGPYQIMSLIGKGGMGAVYKARDSRLNRIVAIKILLHDFSDRPDIRERFRREAQAIANLNHPHICVLHDIGHADGLDYLVMEHLDGVTIEQRLQKGLPSAEEVLRFAIEIVDALDKIHRQGVIHRDLKPRNIMLIRSGAKLLDFGLAKRGPSRRCKCQRPIRT